MKKNIILLSVILLSNFIFSNNNSFIPPTVTVSFTPSICDGSVTDIVLNSDTPNTTYTWSATTNNINSSFITFGDEANINQIIDLENNRLEGNITFMITPRANGENGSPIMVNITVNPIPVAYATPGNSTICNNEYAEIDLFSLLLVPGTYYTWTSYSTNITGASSGSGQTILNVLSLVNSIVSGSVIYEITPFRAGCQGNIIVVEIFVNPNPNTGLDGDISASETSTTPIDLFSIISGEEAGGTWTRTDGTGGSFDAIGGTYTPEIGASNSSFKYELTGDNTGCYSFSTATVNIDIVPIGIANTTNQTINNNDFSNIVLSSSNVSNSNFTWTFTSNNISGASNGSGNTIAQQLSLIDVNANGYVDYTITPINNTAIGNTFSARVNIQSTLNSETFIIDNFKLSPNPVIDILNIEDDNQIKNISIYNQLGQMVLSKEMKNNKGQLDLSFISSGIYIIFIETDTRIINKKIIKQ
ncbi:PKD-like domain-containing protein [Flavobacterium sp. UBA7663]|uniref:PKD-like domain-containing protein n=1 Tax=Flavobacterium sp. UBA7663 TaxID=1946557 RepID=UPI0025C6C974|nr:T9SS type A sorting domain-containing protein [Flavobacterium sp. UBA7663]